MAQITYGIATGALVELRHDWAQAVEHVRAKKGNALELTAHNGPQIDGLLDFAASVDAAYWDGFPYVSLHLPSPDHGSAAVWERSVRIAEQLPRWRLVTHPNSLPRDLSLLAPIADRLCIENMDPNKPFGTTVTELKQVFERLPQARFVLDIAHSHRIDPGDGLARSFVDAFAVRFAHVHASTIDSVGWHHRPRPSDRAWIEAILEYAATAVGSVVCQWEMLPTWEYGNQD
jgi:hypothetical protein